MILDVVISYAHYIYSIFVLNISPKGAVINSLGCQPGVVLIEELKTHSSKWIKTKGQQYQKFYWQNGYGGFSIHPAQTPVVKNYISVQDEHHKDISFKDEYRAFLKEYDINYDEKYVGD